MPAKLVFDVAKAVALNAAGMSLSAVARLPGMPSQAVIKRRSAQCWALAKSRSAKTS